MGRPPAAPGQEPSWILARAAQPSPGESFWGVGCSPVQAPLGKSGSRLAVAESTTPPGHGRTKIAPSCGLYLSAGNKDWTRSSSSGEGEETCLVTNSSCQDASMDLFWVALQPSSPR